MDDLTQQFRAHAREKGADLIGIAPIERFDELAADKHPAAIFPETRSVIVIGKRVVRGAIRGVEEGTSFDIYDMYGRNWLSNRNLAMTTFKAGEFLEDNGWEAVPLPNIPPQTPPMGVPVREGQPAPNVMLDMDDAAIRAGLGEIGYCGLFLSPQFGPRQRFQMILTDAVLTPDPILSQPVCPTCREHAAFCILGAIDPSAERTVTVCGKDMGVAGIDHAKCKSCKNGASPNAMHPSGHADRMAAVCTRSCIAYLEESNAIENTFQNPFRKRAPWGIIQEQKVL
ncbi:MAG: hypothetical protein P4L33_01695 [Capsulimonadaceae bacterium]|nr:hypothetical protein [Capsulimonadaceae bacterium]